MPCPEDDVYYPQVEEGVDCRYDERSDCEHGEFLKDCYRAKGYRLRCVDGGGRMYFVRDILPPPVYPLQCYPVPVYRLNTPDPLKLAEAIRYDEMVDEPV